MAKPVSFVSVTFNDNTVRGNGSVESTTISVPVITLTAANLTAQLALHDALIAALDDITLGVEAKEETTLIRSAISAAAASSSLAQRENKYLLRYHGNTLQEKFQVSVGTADLTKLMPNSEFIDLTASEGLALKTAFEAVVRSPGDGAETVTLDSVQFVGRNT